MDLTSVAAGPSTDRSIGKYVRCPEKVRDSGPCDDGRTSNRCRSDVRARAVSPGPEDGNEMRRLRTLEGRLRGRLLALALLPTLLVLAAAWVVGARSLEWLGTLGPWTEVAESGRALIDEAAPAAADNPALEAARERHRLNLSESLTQAQRWGFIGERIIAATPAAVLFLMLLIAAATWAVSRRLAREMARPIQELVGWSGRLAAGEPIDRKSVV